MVSGEADGLGWIWAGGALHKVQWGDEVVAFNEATATTHVFDEDTVQLVDALCRADRAVTSAVLWRSAFGEAPTESDCQALEELLQRLRQSGLVTASNS